MSSECAKPQDVGNGGNLLTYKGKTHTTIWANVINMLSGGLTGIAGSQAIFSFPPFFALGTVPGRNDFDVDLTVNGKADGVGNQVYKNKITYTKKFLGLIPVSVTLTDKSYNANANTLAYDYFPGGNQDLSTELGFPESGSTLLLQKNITFSHQAYCHVPVPSALDLGSGTVVLIFADYFTPYRGSSPPITPKSTPFTNGFITAFNGSPNNEPHTQIERRNGDWIASQLQGGQDAPASCEFLCSVPAISGNNSFCTTSGIYTLPGLPAAATVTWSAEPAANVTINNPLAQQTTLTGSAAGGTITLTATISNICGNSVSIQKTSILIGMPTPGPITWTWNAPPNRVLLDVADVPGATSYKWYLDGVLKATTTASTYQLPMTGNVSCGNFYYFGVRATGSCAISQESFVGAQMPPCGFNFMVSPNSGADNVTIEGTARDETTAAGAQLAQIQAVELYDKTGIIRKNKLFSKDRLQ